MSSPRPTASSATTAGIAHPVAALSLEREAARPDAVLLLDQGAHYRAGRRHGHRARGHRHRHRPLVIPEVAHEMALKAAETDATKRALATFGNPFGLALYDKDLAPRDAAHQAGTVSRRAGAGGGRPSRSSFCGRRPAVTSPSTMPTPSSRQRSRRSRAWRRSTPSTPSGNRTLPRSASSAG